MSNVICPIEHHDGVWYSVSRGPSPLSPKRYEVLFRARNTVAYARKAWRLMSLRARFERQAATCRMPGW